MVIISLHAASSSLKPFWIEGVCVCVSHICDNMSIVMELNMFEGEKILVWRNLLMIEQWKNNNNKNHEMFVPFFQSIRFNQPEAETMASVHLSRTLKITQWNSIYIEKKTKKNKKKTFKTFSWNQKKDENCRQFLYKLLKMKLKLMMKQWWFMILCSFTNYFQRM